jgi:N-acetylmuramoyl-L-alanine amidase
VTLTLAPDIHERPSPNHSARKPGVRVDTVLIHHTASTGDSGTLEWLRSPTSEVSAHYLVGTVGTVWQLVPEERKAWHAGLGRLPWETCRPYDVNHRSVGIEIVNPGDGKTPFTEAQYRALAWLVPDIVRGLGSFAVVRPSDASSNVVKVAGKTEAHNMVYVLGHRDVAPGRKTDPADNFDWGRIREALAGGVA